MTENTAPETVAPAATETAPEVRDYAAEIADAEADLAAILARIEELKRLDAYLSAPLPVAQEATAAHVEPARIEAETARNEPHSPRLWRVSGSGFKAVEIVADSPADAVREFVNCRITGGNLCAIGNGIPCQEGAWDFIATHPEEGSRCVTVEAA